MILGLFNNIIGKELFYESDFIWLDNCIDQNRDGIDDFTGEPALTYGNITDQYFNTCLMIKFKIISIQKISVEPPILGNLALVSWTLFIPCAISLVIFMILLIVHYFLHPLLLYLFLKLLR